MIVLDTLTNHQTESHDKSNMLEIDEIIIEELDQKSQKFQTTRLAGILCHCNSRATVFADDEFGRAANCDILA